MKRAEGILGRNTPADSLGWLSTSSSMSPTQQSLSFTKFTIWQLPGPLVSPGLGRATHSHHMGSILWGVGRHIQWWGAGFKIGKNLHSMHFFKTHFIPATFPLWNRMLFPLTGEDTGKGGGGVLGRVVAKAETYNLGGDRVENAEVRQ